MQISYLYSPYAIVMVRLDCNNVECVCENLYLVLVVLLVITIIIVGVPTRTLRVTLAHISVVAV